MTNVRSSGYRKVEFDWLRLNWCAAKNTGLVVETKDTRIR
jgi:hypothetical protein